MTGDNLIESLPDRPWDDLLRRLEGIGRQLAVGAHEVTIHVMIHEGRPVQWLRPEIRSLEPKSSARAFLDLLEDRQNPP